MARPGNQHCARCIGTLSFPITSCRRWTRATRCLSWRTVYTKVDARCDKLHGQARRSNVDRRKYCQLSSTDNSLSPEFDKKCSGRKYLYFWSCPNFFTTQFRRGRIKEAYVPKSSSTSPSVSTQYQLLTDRHTDTDTVP